MMHRGTLFNHWLVAFVLVTLLGSAFGVRAQTAEAAPEAYTAVTVGDPTIPVDHLELLLRPLTKEELAVEAAAWIGLVKGKVQEISEIEIEIRTQKQLSEETVDAAKQEVKAVTAEAKAAVEEEAKAAADEAKAAVEEAKAASESTEAGTAALEATATSEAETEAAAEAEAEAALEAAEAAKEAAEAQIKAAKAAADEEIQAQKATAAEAIAAMIKQKAALESERVGLVDRANAVMNAWEKKGGDPSTERLYLVAVSGLTVDVKDVSSAWLTITEWVKSPEGGIRWVFNLVKFLAILLAFWILARVIGKLVDRGLSMGSQSLSMLMRQFLSKAIRRVIIAIGVIVALAALEVNIGPILAAIGALGFVVGFALQGSLSNFANGLMILGYRPFDVGDFVEAGGVAGTVESLNLVSTTIKTPDNKVMIVPNNSIWGGIITNVTGSPNRRVDMVFGVGYGDDLDKAQAILERIVTEHPKVLKTPEPVVRVNELGDSSVNFICRPWTMTSDYWDVYWAITRSVKRAFDEAGISIPYPQTDVHLHQVEANNA